ncbi:MAG: MBL fold metallo-hydrolase, partial [Candidatus Krumholzibacteria bacterium]|nr:MBL fold metallo-hydrolase [Candidatus Krumholzibacteria bacterium]
MDDIRIRHLTVGPLGTNCFLVSCVKSSETIIIDPGGDSPSIISAIKEDGLTPVMIVLTHGHSDHMASAAELTREFDIDIAMHGDDIETMKKSVEDSPLWGLGDVEYPEVKTLLSAGDKIEFGELEAEVRHTPGHTL